MRGSKGCLWSHEGWNFMPHQASEYSLWDSQMTLGLVYFLVLHLPHRHLLVPTVHLDHHAILHIKASVSRGFLDYISTYTCLLIDVQRDNDEFGPLCFEVIQNILNYLCWWRFLWRTGLLYHDLGSSLLFGIERRRDKLYYLLSRCCLLTCLQYIYIYKRS